jgi:hypothetical protein
MMGCCKNPFLFFCIWLPVMRKAKPRWIKAFAQPILKTVCKILSQDSGPVQGDRIGRIFAYWAIVYRRSNFVPKHPNYLKLFFSAVIVIY